MFYYYEYILNLASISSINTYDIKVDEQGLPVVLAYMSHIQNAAEAAVRDMLR